MTGRVHDDRRPIAILFDVDGCLISTGGAGTKAWRFAFDRLHGIPADIGQFTEGGMTDPTVGRLTFVRVIGREPTDREMARLLAAYLDRPGLEVEQSPGYRVMPGVASLLPRLIDDGVLLGIVSGALEAAAHIKLARGGLNRFFCFGGYGSDSSDRSELTRLAIERSGRIHGHRLDAAKAERGYLHCGPSGAGHFVKTVHNGIEYGLMAAYAEDLNILKHADAGLQQRTVDAETTPRRDPDSYRYQLDLGDIAEVWRRGSVITSWLLDLTAQAFLESPALADFTGRVSDSGEGRWTSIAAIDVTAPAPVLTTALYARFTSRGEGDFADRILSAMRLGFGGHVEIKG